MFFQKQKIILKFILLGTLFISVLFFAGTVYAEASNPSQDPKQPCPADWETSYTLIPQTKCLADRFRTGNFVLGDVLVYMRYITEVLLVAAATISLLFIIIGGFTYALSPVIENKESGKQTITHAIIGLVVSMSAWFIINTVLYVVTI